MGKVIIVFLAGIGSWLGDLYIRSHYGKRVLQKLKTMQEYKTFSTVMGGGFFLSILLIFEVLNIFSGNEPSIMFVIGLAGVFFIWSAIRRIKNVLIKSGMTTSESTLMGTDGLEYTQENDCYTVTGYHGTEKGVVIPDSYQGIPVTKVGPMGLRGSDIQSLTIGKNIESIGSEAFRDCTALHFVDISKCDRLRIIEAGAFMNCWEVVRLDFQHCSQLEIIGSSAFSGCTSMKEIEIPESIKEAGEYLFLGWLDDQEVIISGDPSLWKLYRDGKEPAGPFAKNENRTWMLLTKALITYKKEFSNHLLNREEQYERLEKNIQAALDRETGHSGTYKILSREENEVMVLKDTVHFYQCTFQIQGQVDDMPVRKTFLAKVTASGSEYYADDWEITVENIDYI